MVTIKPNTPKDPKATKLAGVVPTATPAGSSPAGSTPVGNNSTPPSGKGNNLLAQPENTKPVLLAANPKTDMFLPNNKLVTGNTPTLKDPQSLIRLASPNREASTPGGSTPLGSTNTAKYIEDFHHLDGTNTGKVTQATIEEHMGHHKEWGEFFTKASQDTKLTEKERVDAKTQADANNGRYQRLYQIDQNYNAFTLGKNDLTEADINRVSAYDGNAGDISQKDIEAARALAKSKGIDLTPPDPNPTHTEAPATPAAKFAAGEMGVESLSKTLYQIDNKTRSNSLDQATVSKFVETQSGIQDILNDTKNRSEYRQFDLKELQIKTASNVKNGTFLLDNFNTLAPADEKNGDRLSIEDLTVTAGNDGNDRSITQRDLMLQRNKTGTVDATTTSTPAGSIVPPGKNKPTFDRTIDRSLVPDGGLNANNIQAYAEKLSQKFGFSAALILAQVKVESGADFSDLAHKGDTNRTHDQGGPSVGPNQITEGVLIGGIWHDGPGGIDLTSQEAESNPALAMQAGLIHLSDYVKDTGSIEMALRGYVGHDQDQYIANIRKYGGDI